MCEVYCTSMTSSTIVAAKMDMTVKLGITLPKSILQKIDTKRGDIPRSRYIRRAIERYLGSISSKEIYNNDNENKAAAASKKNRRNK
jgi:metal-responsive CopG/Arc/MetJ family transcriptional regulator